MPARIAVRYGKAQTIGGVHYTLIGTNGKDLAFLSVATQDSDGFIDGPEEVLEAATKWRESLVTPLKSRPGFDKPGDSDKDGVNPCPPSQASG